MAVFEHLHDAGREFSVSVLVGVSPDGGRKQRDVIHADMPPALEEDDQPAEFGGERLLYGLEGDRRAYRCGAAPFPRQHGS